MTTTPIHPEPCMSAPDAEDLYAEVREMGERMRDVIAAQKALDAQKEHVRLMVIEIMKDVQ